jgi:nucleotide-binding universal stress UspA family protein
VLAFRSILVPVDFSTGSAEALRYALALRAGERGVARGASIEVVHAVDFEAMETEARKNSGALGSLKKYVGERLREFVIETAGRTPKDLEWSILDGGPRSAIPALAEEFDLVVIGAAGKLTAGELVPGGVAEAVVRRSPTPAIVVKWLTALSGIEAGRPFAPREIVFATDFTPFSAQALRHALTFAFAYDARVTALHVVPDPRTLAAFRRMPFPLHEEVDRFYEKELGWRRDELGRFLRDRLGADRPVAIREVVRHGRPAQEIAAECHDSGADLLVLATHGEGGLLRGILGSVAESALRLAPCPVLTVRPRQP